MHVLQRHDVIGHKVVGILTKSWCEVDTSGLDFCSAVFQLDNGVVFSLPRFPDQPFDRSPIPAGSELCRSPEMKSVYGTAVSRLLRPRDDDEYLFGGSTLLMANGVWIKHDHWAPHGTGGAGLRIERSPIGSLASMIDVWDVPPSA